MRQTLIKYSIEEFSMKEELIHGRKERNEKRE